MKINFKHFDYKAKLNIDYKKDYTVKLKGDDVICIINSLSAMAEFLSGEDLLPQMAALQSVMLKILKQTDPVALAALWEHWNKQNPEIEIKNK